MGPDGTYWDDKRVGSYYNPMLIPIWLRMKQSCVVLLDSIWSRLCAAIGSRAFVVRRDAATRTAERAPRGPSSVIFS
eukprot:5100940-Pyramimonas_sp.AAC.1